jgi:hypothetical protein
MYLNVNLGNQPVFTSTIFRKPFICTAAGELLKREVVLAHLILSPVTLYAVQPLLRTFTSLKSWMYGLFLYLLSYILSSCICSRMV